MKKLFLTAIAFVALGIVAQAQDLITVAELSSKIKDANYVVVSAEVETEYAKVHINDAVNVSYKSLEKTGGVEGLLQSPAELAKIFGAKGLSEKKTIVVYDEGAGKYASRLYWTLKYMGAPNVKILDGGMVAWKAGRKPVTKNPSTVKPATFTPALNKAIYADMKEVQAAAGNAKVILVDLREVAEFTGKDPKNNKGRIPGSVNVDHTTLNAANSLYKSKAELEKLFTAAGATKDKTIILVCPTGVRAGKGYFALKSILGYPNVKVYEGGVNEWAATASNKLDK
ncbi:MAG: thiosulfate/3-mercaptopyruvate [Bacteroidetes bacterium]|nr:MAG: thiosulfate/3-mercaptopyruvate [Bacteroidota bacterium]